jgi:hypothetical protein
LEEFPPDLLQAIAAAGGGQIALVIGAGCSVEPPTEVPLAGTLSRTVERRLVLDGVLADGECADPWNLSQLTTLVWQKTGSQSGVVTRFPLDRMRLAKPNLGYKLLVALMAEGAVSHVLSLNFDLAVQHAASDLGIEIAIIDQSGQAVPVRAALVHLHGCANGASESLVLREDVIDAAWRGQWEQVVAQQILGAPVVVFAGLGSAAPVLTATIDMIQAALGGNKTLYQADIGPFLNNGFAQQLNIPGERYIQGGWSAFVGRLAERLAAAQVDALEENGTMLLNENGAAEADQALFKALVARLRTVPLLAVGKHRAFARLEKRKLYRAHSVADDELISEPLLKLAQLAEHHGFEALPTQGGTWLLRREGRHVGQVLLASGGGTRRMAALEPRAKMVCGYIEEHSFSGPDIVLIGGVAPGEPLGSHVDLIVDANPEDLVDGPSGPVLLSADQPDFLERAGELLHAA